MIGFTIEIDNKQASGALESGITSVLLTLKEGKFRLNFGSLDESGMLATTWHAADLNIGDCLKIRFTDIPTLSEPQNVFDYQATKYEDKLDLEYYYRLKKELINEGQLSNNE